MPRLQRLITGAVLLAAVHAYAQDWPTVPFIRHATLQAVNPSGSPAYTAGFPLRLVGVVLNNTEDWLDPTPAYDPGVHPWQLGGQAEFYIQALWQSTSPELGIEYYDPTDFGGTACWIGQNYGNHVMHLDPFFSYTDAAWTAELGRLNLVGGDNVTDPIRAGDLVEIDARAGLHYKGKYNVNEQHNNDLAYDFEIVRLIPAYGLPTPTPLTLADLKNPDDTAIFDWTRQTGGERHQATLVRLRNVWVADAVAWTTNTDITVTDGTRTLSVHLGLSPSFDGTELFVTGEPFNAIGILDQASTSGIYGTDGYRLLAMNAADFTPTVCRGDANCDSAVDFDDINPFVTALVDRGVYESLYPQCSWFSADCNADHTVDFDDINPFVIALVHPPTCP